MLRNAFLYLSRSRWLAERLPRYRLARAAVARFLPGEKLSDALDAAAGFAPAGIGAVLSCLGENTTDEAMAADVARHFHDVLDAIAARGLDAQLAIKPTQLGLDFDEVFTLQHVRELTEHAAAVGLSVWLDMESSAYVDRTLAIFRAVAAERRNIGICLQAYLHRTPADLEAVLEISAAVRLVKGAYSEPAHVAIQRRSEIDDAFASLARRLLAAAAAHGDAPAPILATHDTDLVRRIAADAARDGMARAAYEIHMLYGIRPADQRRLVAEGHCVRVHISYGTAWYPWYMRRLAERPANVLFLVRNLMPGARP